MNLQEIKNIFITVMNKLSDGDPCNQEYMNKMNKCKTYNDIIHHVNNGLWEGDYEKVIEEVLHKAIEPDIPDWDLEFNDLFGHEQPDEPGMLLKFEEIKEHYALLRYNLSKIDGYASEALYALEQINNISSYTDFNPDHLDVDLNSIQNSITEWQEAMRLI